MPTGETISLTGAGSVWYLGVLDRLTHNGWGNFWQTNDSDPLDLSPKEQWPRFSLTRTLYSVKCPSSLVDKLCDRDSVSKWPWTYCHISGRLICSLHNPDISVTRWYRSGGFIRLQVVQAIVWAAGFHLRCLNQVWSSPGLVLRKLQKKLCLPEVTWGFQGPTETQSPCYIWYFNGNCG